MLIHAPEALRLRTTRSLWPWPRPRLTLEMALYVAICAASLGAAALVVFLLLADHASAPVGPLALGPAVAAERH